MIVIVTGGRDFENRELAYATLDRSHARFQFTKMVHGGARGADRLGTSWANDRGLPVQEFIPEWDKYGKAAGMRRNADMLAAYPDAIVVVFPGGRGTADMLRRSVARVNGARATVFATYENLWELSEEAQAARRPWPSVEVLLEGAKHDPIHRDLGVTRAAKSYKAYL